MISSEKHSPSLLDHRLPLRWGVPLLLLLVLLPFAAEALGEGFYIGVASRILIFALAATSLNLILGFGGMVSFGHAAFVGIGAYTVGILMQGGVVSGWAAWPAAFVLGGVFACAIGLVSLRTQGVYFIMITLAFAQMLYFLAVSLREYGGDDGMQLKGRSLLGPLDLNNATATHVELSAAMTGVTSPDGSPILVGLLHSRMPVAEKKAVMALFSSGAMGVLVSTTVIEVGVDVPNASLMVIEHAERFGLSQLHQLRGRVGRGAAASACVLLYATNEGGRVSETARERLRAMAETHDGFEIARRDLEIRGPGEFLGARQSGAAMLRFADLATDTHLLEWARTWAPKMLAKWPDMAQKHVDRWLGGKSDYLKA